MSFKDLVLKNLHLLTCFLIVHQGGAQSFQCDQAAYRPLCPGYKFTCTCVVSSDETTTEWLFIPAVQGNVICNSNRLLLRVSSPCVPPNPSSNGTCGSYLRAINSVPGLGSSVCTTSVLNVTADSSLNGIGIMCRQLPLDQPIGNINIKVIGVPSTTILLNSSIICTNSMSIQWTPLASGANTTFYFNINSTIPGDRVITRVVTDNITMATFDNLIDGSNYSVSVTAQNCAGTSSPSTISVQTLPCAPLDVNVTTVYFQNDSVRDVELFWRHRQTCSVPQYMLTLTTDTSNVTLALNDGYCNNSSCSYVHHMPDGNLSSYQVSLACRNKMNKTGQPFIKTQNLTNPGLIEVFQTANESSSAVFECQFQGGSSHYCLICCSTDPSVPSYSTGYLSSSSGQRVNVSVEGLASQQTYHCKAAAIESNVANCGGPVVGNVKVYFSFVTGPHIPPLSTAAPTAQTTQGPSMPNTNNTSGDAITKGQIVGIVIGVVLLVIILLLTVVVVVTVGRVICKPKHKVLKIDHSELRDKVCPSDLTQQKVVTKTRDHTYMISAKTTVAEHTDETSGVYDTLSGISSAASTSPPPSKHSTKPIAYADVTIKSDGNTKAVVSPFVPSEPVQYSAVFNGIV